MPDALIGNFDTVDVIEAIRQTPRPGYFLRERLFGGRTYESRSKAVMMDFKKGKRRIAPMMSRYAGTTLVEKRAFETRMYTPPKVGCKDVFTGEEGFERTMGEAIGGDKDPAIRMAELIAEAYGDHDDMITRREELMCAEVLSTGIINIVGEGVNDMIDLNHTNTVTLAGTSCWASTDSDPVTDIHKWKIQNIKLSGVSPDTLILGDDAAIAFLEDDKVRDLLDVRNINIGRIDPKDVPGGAIYLGTIDAVDIFQYPEYYDHPTTGDLTPMVPTDAAILFPSAARNLGAKMLYAAFYDVEDKVTYVGPRIPRMYTSKEPNVQYSELLCFPLPQMPDVDSWLVATVI